MSDNKKYYYIKLKDNYFDQDNIKILESLDNGYIFSLIIIKLYLKAAKYEGQLKMTELIPYDQTNIEILSKVIGHDASHVKEAIKTASNLGLIDIINNNEIWCAQMQTMVGHSTTEADRKKNYRQKIKAINEPGRLSSRLSGQTSPEIEIEKEKEKEKEIEIEIEKEKELEKFSFKKSFIELGVSVNHINDWIDVRKNKKATNSKSAYIKAVKEMDKAVAIGYTYDYCVQVAAENSWSGFKYSYFIKEADPVKTKTERELVFFQDIKSILAKTPEYKDKNKLNEFWGYWTQTNKYTGKMKFEEMEYFDMPLKLKSWFSNSKCRYNDDLMTFEQMEERKANLKQKIFNGGHEDKRLN